MNMYLSVFKIRFINTLQYRAVVLAHIISRIVWSLMEILAFAAFYRADPAAFPMAFSQTVSYIWMQQTLLILFSVVFADGEMSSSIESGAIAYELVRPISLYGRWFFAAAASRISFTALNCAPALLLAFVMPAPYNMSLPPDIGLFFLFIFSLVLALCVVVAFAMLMYVSMFYTLSHRGVRIIVTAVTGFLSGGVIPLPFFPVPMLAVINWLPFAAMQNMPLRIYTGSLAGSDAFMGIALQIFWLAVLLILGRLFMGRALKKVIVQGG